jgi:hypothetical protein
MKNAMQLADVLMIYAGEVRSYWRTSTGALSDAGCEYRRFLLDCADKVAAVGKVVSWEQFEQITEGDEYDYTLYAWEEVPEIAD